MCTTPDILQTTAYTTHDILYDMYTIGSHDTHDILYDMYTIACHTT